ncbi:MAG: hypothetical protein ABW151_11155 [Pseudorhodoplanes sp.]
MKAISMRRLISILAAIAFACPLVVISSAESDAQGIGRRHQRPLVPRSVGRREADRQAALSRPQMYVPGHFVWDSRRGQYSWVGGRWERYDPKHAFVGGGLQYRNGQWTLGPAR